MHHPVTLAARHHGAIQIEEEFDDLVNLLESRPPAHIVLEVGTCGGGSFHALAVLAADRATMISIDYAPQLTHVELAALTKPGQAAYQIIADSNDPDTAEKVREIIKYEQHREGIDVLFIDADHHETAVRADVANYLPLVRPGGIAIFHDITPQDPRYDRPDQNIEVSRVWADLARNYPKHWAFEHPRESHTWGGIGVIEKP